MRVAVVGGGVTGAFCAYYLAREGCQVTLVEAGELGFGSIHAAGLIEREAFYQINTWGYLREALGFARRGVLRLRRVDPHWALSYLTHFGRRLRPEETEVFSQMNQYAISEYRRLGEEDSGWGYTEPGLIELYEEERNLEAALHSAASKRGWRQIEWEGYAGGIMFEESGLVVPEKFMAKMAAQLGEMGVEVLRGRAGAVWLDGRVELGGRTLTPEKAIVAAGVECRRLGVPVTGVGGAGYRFTPTRPERPRRPIIVYEKTLSVVGVEGWVKATLGLDFSFNPKPPSPGFVARLVGHLAPVSDLVDMRVGVRPTTPDGLPIVGAKERLVVATGGFRLGWTFAPAIAREAVDLALGKKGVNPTLSRFTENLRSGSLS